MSGLLKGMLRHVLRTEESGGEGGGGGGGAAASEENGGAAGAGGDGDQGGGDTSAGGGAAAGDGAAGNAGGSALAQGKEGQGAETLAIPEKYQVKKEGSDEIDQEASLQKLLQGHKSLEGRVGSGGLAPAAPTDYKIEVPDQFKEHWAPEGDPMLQEFLVGAHGAKLSQEQMNFVMGEYFKIAPALVAGARQLTNDECIADLRTEWKDDATYKRELNKSYNGLLSVAGKDAEGLMKDYGNDPRFIRMLNRIGTETQEDNSIHNEGGGAGGGNGSEIQELLMSEAYTNPKHPQHATVSKKIADYFAAQAKADEAAGNAPLM